MRIAGVDKTDGVSFKTKPVYVAVSVGLGSPCGFVFLSALMVSEALLTVSVCETFAAG